MQAIKLTKKHAAPTSGHVFQATGTIFNLVQNIIGTNLLTKFHDDLLTRKNAPPPGSQFHDDRTINVGSRVKNAPPLSSHVFQANVTIFKLIQDIIETNLPTKFHEDWTINVASRVLTKKTAPPPGGHTNLPTKFHEDWTINVASRVFTRSTAPPPGGHTNILTKTNVLTKFHEDQTINVASRVFTRQNVDDGRRTTDKRRLQKLTMSTLCSE
ncbi:hypothetical protein DPMN_026709 [Dreissena polymorpha]|uniref:Uncharacterized protein n=1 Tax=Dreissena polymorpha TaxID=45954 RepID=A0A9D4LTY9_DREPO|nr:hypothetical protein DPMN_026709 [Dreissena polymorpha]